MAACTIIQFPNPKLREKSSEIDATSNEAVLLTKNLEDTLLVNGGLGLAAPQIGVAKRVISILRSPVFADLTMPGAGIIFTLYNPRITEFSKEKSKEKEACLSINLGAENVTRAKKIIVEFQMLDGSWSSRCVSDYAAAIIQHEIDHLDGLLYIDRLSNATKEMALQKFRKNQKKELRTIG